MDPETTQLREQNNYLRQLIAFQDQNSESVFEQLSENIDDVFWLRTDEAMIYINPAFEKVWGIPTTEIYQNPQLFNDSIHPDDRNRVTEILNSDTFKKKRHF
ncbi:MAG: PAS domain-containing protein [Bacteroidales bacterium]|nr:PAS domain-containing protein [Bacteroidales bacterium]